MKFSVSPAFTAAVVLFASSCAAQLSGSVGPITSTASKAAKKICNVLDYGAKADKQTDLGPALLSAFTACKTGGIVWIPSGDYAMSTWQTLNGGTGWAIQLDGIIHRTGTDGGHMIIVKRTSDFEFFSRSSQGAMQGYGYEFHAQDKYGPRLLRLVMVDGFSVHDIALVDSPAFHLIIDNCNNGEIYNIVIRGGNRGGLDGIDTSGTNLWYHDIEVTNKDECVTIKTPSSYTLVENIYCNWSGGSAIGSIGAGTAISNIEYNKIYTWRSNQMMMIKSNGGDGYVRNCTFNNFIGHSNAYALNVNQYWEQRTLDAGNGVELSDLTFSNWQGTIQTPSRPSINMVCADDAPCVGMVLENLDFWTDTDAAMKHTCKSSYGQGYCLKDGSGGAFATTTTIDAAPTAYLGPKMPDDLPEGLGLTAEIPIPTIPASFFPNVPAITPLLNGGGAGAGAGAGGAASSTVVISSSPVTLTSSTMATSSALPVTSGTTEADTTGVSQSASSVTLQASVSVSSSEPIASSTLEVTSSTVEVPSTSLVEASPSISLLESTTTSDIQPITTSIASITTSSVASATTIPTYVPEVPAEEDDDACEL